MSYVALYREWRPKTFDDVVEQSGTVRILKNAINNDRIGHAYLFCGTRGTGKTSIAKIFSRAINCLNPQDGNPCNECEICKGILNGSIMDVIEIDAASNNSVDNVRDIISEIAYVPTVAKYKVYIIDEVHMLSTGAFNALLKTLEEPPDHVIFILATTDPNKLPATVLSRCQRFDFKRISQESIVERLQDICNASNVQADNDALIYIAQASDGALRDAISILDQCLSMINETLTYEDVLKLLGVVNDDFTGKMVSEIIAGDVDSCLDLINTLLSEGKELLRFQEELIQYFRDLLIVKSVNNTTGLVFVKPDILTLMKNQAAQLEQNEIIFFIRELASLERDLKLSTQKKIVFEVTIIKLCTRTYAEEQPVQASHTSVQHGAQKTAFEQAPRTNPQSSNQNRPVSKAVQKAEPSAPRENREEPEDGARASGRPLDSSDLRDVISELKSRGDMKVLTYLSGVRAVYFSDKQINLIFGGKGNDIKKTSMQEKVNSDIIHEVFGKILQKEYIIKYYTEEEYAHVDFGDEANSHHSGGRKSSLSSDNNIGNASNSANLIDRLKKLEDSDSGVSIEFL